MILIGLIEVKSMRAVESFGWSERCVRECACVGFEVNLRPLKPKEGLNGPPCAGVAPSRVGSISIFYICGSVEVLDREKVILVGLTKAKSMRAVESFGWSERCV